MDDTPEPQPLRRFDSLTSQTLSKRISRALLTSILRGEVLSGNALPSEDDLASQFDVSRPVVREAVKEPVLRFGRRMSLKRRPADGFAARPPPRPRGHPGRRP